MVKILVIEEALDVAQMLKVALASGSYKIDVATGIAEALAKMVLFDPDMVLMDIRIGQHDGRDICKEIRKFNKKVPVLLMSATAELLAGYEACEANDTIEKPFEIDDLLQKIDRLLGKNNKETF